MTRGSHITAIGPEEERPAQSRPEAAEDGADFAVGEVWDDAEDPPRRNLAWIAPALILAAILGWTGFFIFAHQQQMLAGADPRQWSAWIGNWAMPVLLLVALWLLSHRSGDREAARFSRIAHDLSRESRQLEARLTTVNRELSLAREFIAAQSRDLESLGRVAADRLSQNADRLKELIHENSVQVETIATVSSTALDNMAQLRSDFPVIANSARDVTSQIGNAGRTAHAQLEELIDGFNRLNEFGAASERQIAAVRGRVDSALAAIDSQSARLDEAEGIAVTALQQRLAVLREHAETFRQEATDMDAALGRMAAGLSQLSNEVETIASRGGQAGEELSQAADVLAAKLAANRDVLKATDDAVAQLTDASVRLLELIQAGAEHSREQLPMAIGVAEDRLIAVEQRLSEFGTILGEADRLGFSLSENMSATHQAGKAALEELEALQQRLLAHHEDNSSQVGSLRGELAALSEESSGLSEKVNGELSEAIARLRGALRSAVEELGSGKSEAVDELAEHIGAQSSEAIERAIRNRAAEAIGELEQAAAHASGVGREAARQLHDQLAIVDELAGRLEDRVTRARARAEERVDNDFARRVALITESLNSNAIDISKALSNDITDMAWASYLRGDRGIFTRRAVRLLDNAEAREIAEIYQNDADFREHVSRYIHDFESILRTMLSTRDGNAISVTLLSSDMGKLYVALAQAIERLRT